MQMSTDLLFKGGVAMVGYFPQGLSTGAITINSENVTVTTNLLVIS
jgi:hypothetical protein